MDRGKRSEKAELLAVVIVGFLLKLFAGRSSLTENGILLPGYDEYYHMRRILYTVDHFPGTLWFDSYLNYPHGFNITWPPLFDQVSAALSVALGQHSQAGIEMVSAYVPMLIGSIAIVVVYYLVRELFDGRVALLAAFMTALAPYYLLYTMFGALDHHCLEVLLLLMSLLFIVMALSRSEKRISFAVLAGLTMAALAYTWQGTDVYLGIFLGFALVKMALDQKSGLDSKDTATTFLAAYGVALILVLPFWGEPWMSPSFLGLAAMVVAISVMFAFSRLLAAHKLPWTMFPLSLLAVVIVFALISSLTGGLFGVGGLINSGLSYIWGGEMIGKISEAQPLIYDIETFNEVLFSGLGLNLLLSLAAFAAIVAVIRKSDSVKRSGRLLLLVWALCTILLTIGQSRFLYLSTISMGIMISILFFSVMEMVEKRLAKHEQKVPRWLAPVLLLLLVLPTMTDTISFAQSTPPAVEGDWYQSLAWLKDNSNTTSFYDNPSKNAEYSVMSWWDYGNWILYLSQRPVVANNFQVGVEDAAKFYLSESEEIATAVLDALGSRYIVADYNLIYGKLPALTTWANEDFDSYMKMTAYGSQIEAVPMQRLFNTTLARLYLFDGAGTGHFRLIYESSTFLGESPAKSEVKIFEYVPGVLIRVKTGPDKKVGALLNMTSNQGRAFIYVNQASLLPNGDAFEIRVPYSTESSYETHAINPYLIFSGNEAGVNMQSLEVSEEDVLKGKTFEVSL
jgi:dolichyl-diphosphooligosaccharide--protein glycosyltransferase